LCRFGGFVKLADADRIDRTRHPAGRSAAEDSGEDQHQGDAFHLEFSLSND
jgi:hypothetical protein